MQIDDDSQLIHNNMSHVQDYQRNQNATVPFAY